MFVYEVVGFDNISFVIDWNERCKVGLTKTITERTNEMSEVRPEARMQFV